MRSTTVYYCHFVVPFATTKARDCAYIHVYMTTEYWPLYKRIIEDSGLHLRKVNSPVTPKIYNHMNTRISVDSLLFVNVGSHDDHLMH